VKYLSTWDVGASSSGFLQFSPSSVNIALNNMTWVSNASTVYQIYYAANFTVQFAKPLLFPFAADRLIQGGATRERWYYLNVTSGPTGLVLSDYKFNDTTVAYTDVISNFTNFGRSLTTNWNNVTIDGNVVEDGVTFTGGYIAPGECDVLFLDYTASASLNLVVADQTSTPVSGAVVNLFWDNMPYGTLMSLSQNVTLAPMTTGSDGIISYPSVPQFGNYSITVQYQGSTYGPYPVYINQTADLVTTAIPHLPLWVISYVSFSAVIFVIGVWRYRKFRQAPQ
jgi:hypothetical protein